MKVCWKSNNGYAPKGAEVHSPVASEATPWVKCAVELAPCKGKSVETERVMFTFALAGRSVIWCGGLPRVSLLLPWAMNFCPFRACPLRRALIEGKLRSVGKIFPCRMPPSTSPHSHTAHTTLHTQHITFHILNTPPPNLHVFSVAPRPASKYAILSAFSQLPIIQPLIV